MIAIVPRPVELSVHEDPPVHVTSATRVLTGGSPHEVQLGVLLAQILGRLAGRTVTVVNGESEARPGDFLLVIDPHCGPEGSASEERYSFDSTGGRVVLRAATPVAAARALSTMDQLLELTELGTWAIPAVRVADAPRYPWRGLSLDLARHFFGPEDLRRVISLMARYKLNVLHLHLTDDQGWRLDVPGRPELAALGSRTSVGGGPGGYLTMADLHEIQAYAAVRGILVVPEVDVPGHTNAALHAVPALNPDGVARPEYTGIEVGFSTLDPSLPATDDFLRDVFGAVAEGTWGNFVHLGGDEAHGTSKEDYEAVVSRAAQILREAGKTPVGWQEFASSPASREGVVQVWDTSLDLEPVRRAAEEGALVVLSPATHVYLDMKFHEGFPLGLEWAGRFEVREAYDWEPEEAVPGLDPSAILGVEGAVWTETLSTFDELSTMLLPRLLAVCEVAWTRPELRGWDDFAARVAAHQPMWRRLRLSWYPSPQVPWDAVP